MVTAASALEASSAVAVFAVEGASRAAGAAGKICPRNTRIGAPGRDRTCDLVLRRHSLYPLSYGRAPPLCCLLSRSRSAVTGDSGMGLNEYFVCLFRCSFGDQSSHPATARVDRASVRLRTCGWMRFVHRWRTADAKPAAELKSVRRDVRGQSGHNNRPPYGTRPATP